MKRVQSDCDRISNLHVDLIHKILTFLPLKDAAKTCVLSRKWRDTWTRVPQLVFDDDFGALDLGITDPAYRFLKSDQFMRKIFEVLLAHEGPISKFSLEIPGLRSSPQMDGLVRHLSKKRVQDFTLNCYGYNLHSCFFSAGFSELVEFELHCAQFKAPASFGGFSKLTNIKLAVLELADGSLENFLPKCPLLESLSLVYTNCCERVAIFGPCLKLISLCGKFKSISFEDTPLLADISIQAPGVTLELAQEMASSMIEGFGSLPLLRVLSLGSDILKVLGAGSVAGRLPTSLNSLEYFELTSPCFNVNEDVLGLFALIRSSPKLQAMSIEIGCTHSHGKRICPTILQPQQDITDDDSEGLFEFLEVVSIDGTNGSRAELDFIRFILANAPKLRMLYLKPGRGKDSDYIRSKTAKFRCASSQVTIVFRVVVD